MYHVNSYESKNFSKTEAKVSIGLSKFFNVMTFKIWKINVPEKVQEIADHEGDEIHKTFEHDDLLLGFRFLADMINRLFFIIVVFVEILAFSATILTMPAENSRDLSRHENLLTLEHDYQKSCNDDSPC